VKILLIVNPYASSVTERARQAAVDALSVDGHDLTVSGTDARDHATELARAAAADATDVVVVLGGDGTVNEAAHALVGTGTAVAPLPGGSTNVFARTVGFDRRVDRALLQMSELLRRGSTRAISVGSVNGRHFLFHVGVGYDAAVVAQVEGKSELKRKLGQAVFVYAAFAAYFKHYDHSRPRFALHLPDGTSVDDGYFLICLNSDPYTYFGPRPLTATPDAVDGRGLVSVTVRSLTVRTLLGVFGSALGTGRRLRAHPDVDYRTDLERLEVWGHGPVPYQVDGDFLGEADELSISYHRDALKILAP